MAEGFGNIQKLVDEEMDEDGSGMCHILKLVAMAIFSQRGGSELGPSSPAVSYTHLTLPTTD